ncbi:hypothetical protein [Roseiconus nitratireducens]|nr:hypothetical protein [Roseiconus nitratireducens]
MHSVCGPVLTLLRDGQLAECGRTRATPYGSQAAVIVAPEYAR